MITAQGPNGEAMLFGGAIDAGGNFAEVFMHVDIDAMRRTGYTFGARGQ
jgi:hypothetical protein